MRLRILSTTSLPDSLFSGGSPALLQSGSQRRQSASALDVAAPRLEQPLADDGKNPKAERRASGSPADSSGSAPAAAPSRSARPVPRTSRVAPAEYGDAACRAHPRTPSATPPSTSVPGPSIPQIAPAPAWRRVPGGSAATQDVSPSGSYLYTPPTRAAGHLVISDMAPTLTWCMLRRRVGRGLRQGQLHPLIPLPHRQRHHNPLTCSQL